jgi:hypothetical protein
MVYKSPPVGPVVSQMNPAHLLPPYSIKKHFNP